MLPWLTHWLAWARRKALGGVGPRAVAAKLGFERAGAPRWESPVPWTADAAVLDMELRAPHSARHKPDFTLRLPNATFPADTYRPVGADRFRLSFRFPVPPDTVTADLLCKGRVIASVPVHVLTPVRFLTSLRLTDPTVSVRLGSTTVAATAFCPDGCTGILASAVLRCPTGLAPLAELGVRVMFHDSRTGTEHAAPVALGAAQLARSEALVTAVCPEVPRHTGGWWVIWMVGGRPIATLRVHPIPGETFEPGVRVLETRFAVLGADGDVHTTKLPPVLSETGRVGPCFVLAGSEPGAVGMCTFEISAFASSGADPGIHRTATTVVTDGPSVFVPALFEVSELVRVTGFELRLNGRLLAVASLRPVPSARITGEGGFVPPPDFVWSPAADDELADRLRRLS